MTTTVTFAMRSKLALIARILSPPSGKPISTLSRSLVGADALKAELGEICGDCTMPDEHSRILEGTMQAAVKACQGG
ncbi:DUF2688 domain-containing protein [Xanthomonas phaseoli]|uniref:DUF2688 domain-containing protein n=1 Tax=Xanthomonas phaseoli TaxID=1985254 RepID=UPI001ED8C1BF|nr:DUF2688 domain-containing protein [Xanthomonas phaseoli]